MSTLCFIDTETTGLDARIHQPYDVCMWREDREAPLTLHLPHTLDFADQSALKISGYWERGMEPFGHPGSMLACANVAKYLQGVTLVGSNPAFDAAMLTRFIGTPVWHHRMIDVGTLAMVAFGLGAPTGLAQTCEMLRANGFEIPEPDHTAEGDVRATKAAYEALRTVLRHED